MDALSLDPSTDLFADPFADPNKLRQMAHAHATAVASGQLSPLQALVSGTYTVAKPAPALGGASGVSPSVVDTSAGAPAVDPEGAEALRKNIDTQGVMASDAYSSAIANASPTGAVGRNLQAAANAQMEANALQADIAQKYAYAKGDVLGEQSKQMAADNAADAQADNLHAQELEQAKKRAQMAGDIATQAEVKDFWHDKSTGSRVLGVIAQTLAGAANGLAGTPGAPSALDRIIDHDFEVQKSQVAGKKDASYRAEGALAQLVNSYKDEREGRLAARAAAYKMVQNKISQLDEQMKGEIAPGAADAANAAAQQKIDENIQAVADSQAKTAVQAQSNAIDAGTKLYGSDRIAQAYGQKLSQQQIQIPGLIGTYNPHYLDAEGRQKLSSYSEAMHNLDGYEQDLIHDDKAFKSYAGAITGNALTEGAIRKILGTGAALSATELKAVQSFTLDFLKGQSLASLAPAQRQQFFDGVRRSLARSYGGFIRGRVPEPKFDFAHSTLGRANQINAQEEAAAKAAPQ